MSQEKLGIDALVDIAVDAIEVGREVAPALADGLQLTDTFVIINNFGRLQRIAKSAKTAWAELKDLEGLESEQAAMEISVRAHLENDGTVLNKVGKALKLVARTHRQVENTIDLVEDWKALFEKQAA